MKVFCHENVYCPVLEQHTFWQMEVFCVLSCFMTTHILTNKGAHILTSKGVCHKNVCKLFSYGTTNTNISFANVYMK